MERRIAKYLAVAAAVLMLAACQSGSLTSTAPFNPPGSGTTEKMFVGMQTAQYADTGTLSEYGAPLTAVSSPSVAGIAVGEPWNLATDSSGDVWAANGYAEIGGYYYVTEFTAPFSKSSTPAVTIPVTNDSNAATEGLTFNSAGDLFVATYSDNTVREFAPPLSDSSTATVSITNGMTGPEGLAVDSSGDLWVANYGASDNVSEYKPPFTSGSMASVVISTDIEGPQTLAFDSSGDLWVCDEGAGLVYEFKPPFSNSSAPAVTLGNSSNNQISGPQALAIDAKGNVFVTNAYNATITSYTPPINGASYPSAVISNGTSYPWGITFIK